MSHRNPTLLAQNVRGPCGVAGACASLAFVFVAACDPQANKDPAVDRPRPAPTAAPSTTPAPPPEAPRAPDIIIDGANVSIGPDRMPAGEPGLLERLTVLLTGQPAIAGQPVDFVAMRNAKPSQVSAVGSALRRARATGVNIKTEARDGTTQKLPLSFVTNVPDCAVTAWIARDASINVWPAGGGRAKRILKGMAGPDMTLGTEAIQHQAENCGASELLVGSDDRLTWGLLFDLATMSLHAPGTRLVRTALVTSAVPGRRVSFESP